MQTFLPFPDFAKSAACLDNKRLGKQRVECLQILQTLAAGRHASRVAWSNHPAVNMWRGYELALCNYGVAICLEWEWRGFQDTCCHKIQQIEERLLAAEVATRPLRPPWLCDEALHASHRSNLLRKDYRHYGKFGWKEVAWLPYVWPV